MLLEIYKTYVRNINNAIEELLQLVIFEITERKLEKSRIHCLSTKPYESWLLDLIPVFEKQGTFQD